MSALEALRAAPRRRQELAAERPRLRRIDTPARRMPGTGFALLVVAIVVVGMVGLLVLNTSLQDQGFEVRRAQRTANELAYRVSDLETRVHRAAAPADIAARATDLGMVPNPHAVFIDLATGAVLGQPKAPNGTEVPSLRVSRPSVAVDPTLIQPVTTNVLNWFDLEGVQAPLPPEPPAETDPSTGAPR